MSGALWNVWTLIPRPEDGDAPPRGTHVGRFNFNGRNRTYDAACWCSSHHTRSSHQKTSEKACRVLARLWLLTCYIGTAVLPEGSAMGGKSCDKATSSIRSPIPSVGMWSEYRRLPVFRYLPFPRCSASKRRPLHIFRNTALAEASLWVGLHMKWLKSTDSKGLGSLQQAGSSPLHQRTR
ncbi:uncharacterized protein EI97DRAFT_77149 [Westerdykella ornata]|uniref:Uncharacterized protein n=1 Tax=Westerdykella ornata TaxID=318751 RepID=A0A6A6JKT4_WESOR|nr:uncharacterized protein EI97DRAFT_77149 [Westerdykella ornata]KAF2275499.1 hypothetical protein EI97DRAFT_77149 [Westerdykella ornata]